MRRGCGQVLQQRRATKEFQISGQERRCFIRRPPTGENDELEWTKRSLRNPPDEGLLLTRFQIAYPESIVSHAIRKHRGRRIIEPIHPRIIRLAREGVRRAIPSHLRLTAESANDRHVRCVHVAAIEDRTGHVPSVASAGRPRSAGIQGDVEAGGRLDRNGVVAGDERGVRIPQHQVISAARRVSEEEPCLHGGTIQPLHGAGLNGAVRANQLNRGPVLEAGTFDSDGDLPDVADVARTNAGDAERNQIGFQNTDLWRNGHARGANQDIVPAG